MTIKTIKREGVGSEVELEVHVVHMVVDQAQEVEAEEVATVKTEVEEVAMVIIEALTTIGNNRVEMTNTMKIEEDLEDTAEASEVEAEEEVNNDMARLTER